MQLSLHISQPLLQVLVSSSSGTATHAAAYRGRWNLGAREARASCSLRVLLPSLDSLEPIPERLVRYTSSSGAPIQTLRRLWPNRASHLLWADFLPYGASFGGALIGHATEGAVVVLLVGKLVLQPVFKATATCVE